VRSDEDALTEAIVALASKFGRYGYRRIADLLQMAGWQVSRYRPGSPSAGVSGSQTAPASACGQSTRTTSGPMTSSPSRLTTDTSYVYSR
jgi:predicted alpha/beta hydrolase